MTNKEAIEFLKNISSEEAGRCIGNEGTFFAELMQYHVEALHLAIKALNKIDKIENLKEPMCEDYSIKVRKIMRGDVAEVKDLPPCKECRTCNHCMTKNNKLPKITWEKGYPLIFCARHHEHFAPNDTCEFWMKR